MSKITVTKAELEKRIADLEVENSELRGMDAKRRRQIVEIIGVVRRGMHGATFSLDHSSEWPVIISQIAELRGQVAGEGAVAHFYQAAVHNENARLWYLVRALSGDPTLKPADTRHPVSGKNDPFPGQPNFHE